MTTISSGCPPETWHVLPSYVVFHNRINVEKLDNLGRIRVSSQTNMRHVSIFSSVWKYVVETCINFQHGLKICCSIIYQFSTYTANYVVIASQLYLRLEIRKIFQSEYWNLRILQWYCNLRIYQAHWKIYRL